MSLSLGSIHVIEHLPKILPRYWCRRRGSLGPPQVLISLIVMTVLGCKGYERTIDEMKERLGEVLGWKRAKDVPSAQALCQARRKLDASRCAEVAAAVYLQCSTARIHPSLSYAEMRLLSLDGTKLSLPAYKALRDHFGCPTHGEGMEQRGPQASLAILWDVGANQPVAWRLGPYRLSERVQGLELVSSMGPGDLIIADRGFPSRRMLRAIRATGADFLMRVRSESHGTLREVHAFRTSGQADSLVDLVEYTHHGKPHPDLPPIPVRLLRMTLPDGSTAVFVTSLRDQMRHPAAALLGLYTQRWRIETAFRELKLWHGLERFHARHVDGIAQEICALMIFQLLTSELEAQARIKHLAETTYAAEDPKAALQPPIRFNRRIVADCVVNLIFAATQGDAAILPMFTYSLHRIWRYRQQPRPGRSFVRERKTPARGWKARGTKGKGRP